MKKVWLLPVTILSLCIAARCYATDAAVADKADAKLAIAAIIEHLPTNSSEPVWEVAEKLAELGPEASPALEEALKDASPEKSIAVSYALFKNNIQRPAAMAMIELMKKEDVPLPRRIEAAALIGSLGDEFSDAGLYAALGSDTIPDRIRVEAAKGIWKHTCNNNALEELGKIARESKSLSARQEAILTLGRFGRYDEVQTDLLKLVATPGAVGEEAKRLLYLKSKGE
ncbi:MAG: hypothetical protein JXR97_16720, partial [Planctomycetes bacterium]|nr:hypothetical protein [Planctomycetota bacterium]